MLLIDFLYAYHKAADKKYNNNNNTSQKIVLWVKVKNLCPRREEHELTERLHPVQRWKINIIVFNKYERWPCAPHHTHAHTHTHTHTHTRTTGNLISKLHAGQNSLQGDYLLHHLPPDLDSTLNIWIKLDFWIRYLSSVQFRGCGPITSPGAAAAAWMEPSLWSQGELLPGDLDFQRVFPLKHTRVHFKGRR